MSSRPASPWLAVAIALLPSCAQLDPYDVARMEFDSATGFDPIVGEPEWLEYRDQVLRWPWYVRFFSGTGIDWLAATIASAQPTLLEVENPSGFVRERIGLLTELAAEDFGRIADVAQRALWIVAVDPHSLDQIVALDAVERLLRRLQVDPLAVPPTASDPAAADARVERELERLAAHAPTAR